MPGLKQLFAAHKLNNVNSALSKLCGAWNRLCQKLMRGFNCAQRAQSLKIAVLL